MDRPLMMTSSNGNIFRVTGLCAGNSPVTSKFPAQRPVTRSFDVFFDLRVNNRLSEQSGGWWFETPSCPLWRHRNELDQYYKTGDVVSGNIVLNLKPSKRGHQYIWRAMWIFQWYDIKRATLLISLWQYYVMNPSYYQPDTQRIPPLSFYTYCSSWLE